MISGPVEKATGALELSMSDTISLRSESMLMIIGFSPLQLGGFRMAGFSESRQEERKTCSSR